MLGSLRDCIKSKTELETVNGNGAEKQKKTYTVCYMARAVVTIYA